MRFSLAAKSAGVNPRSEDELFSLIAPRLTCYPTRSPNGQLSDTLHLPFPTEGKPTCLRPGHHSAAGEPQIRKTNFDGTKLPMVVDCCRTTTDGMDSPFSADRLVRIGLDDDLSPPFAKQIGDSCPVRSSPRYYAIAKNRIQEREETLCQLHPRSSSNSSMGPDSF